MDDYAIQFILDSRSYNSRNYVEAAKLMLQSVLKKKTRQLNQRQINEVAILIRDKHFELKNWHGGTLKPREIAERTYSEVILELTPPASADHRTLSELSKDDEEDT
jgi:hypothetical protein